MKKLLFLINDLSGGGAEKVLIDTANALCGDGYDVTLQTVTNKGIFKDRLSDGVKYRSIIPFKNDLLCRVCAYMINFIIPPKITHRLFIGNRYDYEIAFLEGVPTKLIAEAKTKKYAWVHIDLYHTFGLEKVHRSTKRHIECYRNFDKIICVSQNVKDMFIKRFGISDNIDVIYNILDTKMILKKSQEHVERSSRFRIVTVGRAEYQKGFDRLMRIHKRLIDEGFDHELIIVGDGSQRPALERYTEENGISECTIFTGFTDNPYKYMNSADLIVYPSRAEGYSTVATEAVVLGKPVVAANCAGMKEIFGDSEYGLVTENTDEAIYDGIKKMLEDKTLSSYYAKQARERSRDFESNSRLKKLEELFK